MRVLVENDVPDLVRLVAAIGDGVRFVGAGIIMRVGGVGADERAVERVMRDRVEFIAEFDRFAAGFDDGEGTAGKTDDVRIRGVVAVARTRRDFFAEDLAGFGAPDPWLLYTSRCV